MRNVVGESQLDLPLLAGGRADELLVEARQEAARAELEQLIAALRALELLAVGSPGVVDHNEVTLLAASGARPVAKAPKEEIAEAILDEVETLMRNG